MYLQPTVVGEGALLFDVDRGRHGTSSVNVIVSRECIIQ